MSYSPWSSSSCGGGGGATGGGGVGIAGFNIGDFSTGTATTGARAPDCPAGFFATAVTCTARLTTGVVVTVTRGFAPASCGAVIGTIIDAPQAHFPFLPAISGFHLNVLPHAPQENLGSKTCCIQLPNSPFRSDAANRECHDRPQSITKAAIHYKVFFALLPPRPVLRERVGVRAAFFQAICDCPGQYLLALR
jgi:hypothetical protein